MPVYEKYKRLTKKIYKYIISLVFGNAYAYFSDILPVIPQPGVSRLQRIVVCL